MNRDPMTRTDEQHAAPAEVWDAVAEGYDRFVLPKEARIANEALRLVRLEAGETFLDVAAGPGGLALPAARLGAKVLATDFSPGMIGRLEARARAEGIEAEARVMDCHSLDLPDDAFDVTASQFGVMLVPDQPRALREMVRVTKPGGRVLLIAYGSPVEVESLNFYLAALKAVVPGSEGLPDDPPPLQFQAADQEVLRDRLADAGLRAVGIHEAVEVLDFASGEEMWDWLMGSDPMAGSLVADVPDWQRETVRTVLDRMLRERAEGAASAVLTAPVNIAVGTK